MRETDLEQSRSLSFLLHGLSGADLPVQFMPSSDETNQVVGMRPIISSQSFLLPSSFLHTSMPQHSAVERASIAHAAAHLLYSLPDRDVSRLKPMGVAVVSAIEDARVEHLLMKRLPGVRRWFALAMEMEPVERSTFSVLIAKLSHGLLNENVKVDDYWVNKARDLFFSQSTQSGLEDYEAFRSIASILANDLGQMRIQFNPQTYVHPVRYRDDNSYLWDFSSQKSEPDVLVDSPQSASRTKQPKHQSTDIAQELPVKLQTYFYPEWDYRSEIERKDWCAVHEYVQDASGVLARSVSTQRTSKQLLRLPKQLASVLGRDKLFRQAEGDSLDLNAAVDSVALARQGSFGDERYYIRQTLREKKVSLLLLLDLSASVGNFLAGQSQTILDLEKKAAIMLANLAIERGDRIAVHGFCSDKRSGIHYYRYFDFEQPLTDCGLQSLQNAVPQYSTRMGAALRHGVSLFNRSEADARTDTRAIIMITDGAPSDIDVFDPQYLVEDARQVVCESIKNGIDMYGLILDASAAQQTVKIFGSARHRIVSRAESLSIHLESLYRQIRS